MSTKYVVMIQCDIAHKRCSGFACTKAFYEKEKMFKNYECDVKYISFTCGGCCGKGIAAKLEHFGKKSRKAYGINKDDVVIHLSSCMVTDNHHYDRCPHVDYIKSIILKKGYKNIVEKTYVSKNANRKREEGIYNCY
ncbi:CGGC domain-containing protein [Paramaledivibacter caminithermalis]|uniref:Predicted metal-binding protein n=1 Tax=Paramaledivibacter caminithermalis (strain DSM 15212 / CIP 107654 / DViRD3) TaxID=1121301 RepID=A0A1M6QGZ0_PARC5|nr:CGGC domain-containing protein [Paramaledivibacter caminithermalis]SHK19491.1 Predicted metal-binding protein [Paramaledivibacter caminithermalis DSM 15212]